MPKPLNNNRIAGNAPYWVKLVRAGNTITGYTSPMAELERARFGGRTDVHPGYVGLGLASNNNRLVNEATFDYVRVTQAVSRGYIAIEPGVARPERIRPMRSQRREYHPDNEPDRLERSHRPAPIGVYQTERYGTFTTRSPI